ncbi:MAG: glycosyltransferase family 2 protein [Cytophagales bacterium]|nr:MAG: glycosyltransferase family 2 protein [Cytophagales bacterium]
MAAQITIIMPTYNAASYLEEAIKSIVNQTFSNFECIIINDASNDGTDTILSSLSDPRFTILHNQTQRGLSYCINKALLYAKTPYIARMDADDLMLPNRLEIQYHFLENNPQIEACGTWATYFSSDTATLNTHQLTPPTTMEAIHCQTLWGVPFVHASIMFRKELLTKKIYYDESLKVAQDYYLAIQMALQKPAVVIQNIPDKLYLIRKHKQRTSLTLKDIAKKQITQQRNELLKELSIDFEPNIITLINKALEEDLTKISELALWNHCLTTIWEANQKKQLFDREALRQNLQHQWLKQFAGKTYLGKKYFTLMKKSIFSPYPTYNWQQKSKLYLKALMKI